MSELPVLPAYGAALSEALPVRLQFAAGGVQWHDVGRWVADADPADLRLLDRCTGPTLDLGCGPGRMAAALARRGVPALGVDLSARAVAMARARGAAAIRRDVFAPLPGAGRWPFALLIDGNLGIGGDPIRLLRRVRTLLAPGGQLLVEVSGEDVDRRGPARLHLAPDRLSAPFPWAELGLRALAEVAGDCDGQVLDTWTDAGRAFARLRFAAPRPATDCQRSHEGQAHGGDRVGSEQ